MKNKSCIAMNWKDEIKDVMYDSEFEQVDQSHLHYVRARISEYNQDLNQIKEIMNHICRKDNRNETLIQNKISKLQPKLFGILR